MPTAVPSFDPDPQVTAVAAYVREECLRPSNHFGPEFFSEHLELVTRLAVVLARRLGADPLVVALAGYLHDLSAVRNFATLPDHARESATIARSLLGDRGFSPPVVDAVARCVESHSTPPQPGRGTPEEICISNADVLSHLARPFYWSFYLYRVRGLEYAQGLAWLRGRMSLFREALAPESHRLGEEDAAALARMLEQAEEA